jgi:hypothetical protein
MFLFTRVITKHVRLTSGAVAAFVNKSDQPSIIWRVRMKFSYLQKKRGDEHAHCHLTSMFAILELYCDAIIDELDYEPDESPFMLRINSRM